MLYLATTAAAACLALVLFFTFGRPSGTSISSSPAEMLTHVLPDRSTVRLNADSRIRVNEKKWEEKRQLALTGEAYFEVEKGQTFRVETDLGDVEVLGTKFNVYSRSGIFEVFCQYWAAKGLFFV